MAKQENGQPWVRAVEVAAALAALSTAAVALYFVFGYRPF